MSGILTKRLNVLLEGYKVSFPVFLSLRRSFPKKPTDFLDSSALVDEDFFKITGGTTPLVEESEELDFV